MIRVKAGRSVCVFFHVVEYEWMSVGYGSVTLFTRNSCRSVDKRYSGKIKK